MNNFENTPLMNIISNSVAEDGKAGELALLLAAGSVAKELHKQTKKESKILSGKTVTVYVSATYGDDGDLKEVELGCDRNLARTPFSLATLLTEAAEKAQNEYIDELSKKIQADLTEDDSDEECS